MGCWLSLLIGVLTAVAGCVGTGVVANLCVDWFRISSAEGAAGFFVVGLALIGLILGFGIGVACARLVTADGAPSFPRALAVALGTTGSLLVAAAGLAWLAADFPPTLDGTGLVVEIEVKLPAGRELPPAAAAAEYDWHYNWHATITADHGQRHQSMGTLRLADASRVGDAWVMPATVALTTSDPGKSLGIKIGEGDTQYFRMPLPGRPSRADLLWSPWLTDPHSGDLGPVPNAEAVAVRYRVQPDVVPAPAPPGGA